MNGAPASQNLRSACRAVSWRSPSVETATRSLGFIGQALVRACGQLSSCDLFSEVQADGADELDLPRSVDSARGVPTLLRLTLERTTPWQACRLVVRCCHWLTTKTAKPSWRYRPNNACSKERFRTCSRCKSILPCSTAPCHDCMCNPPLWPAMRNCCSTELRHECQEPRQQPFDRCSRTGADAIGTALASDETDVAALC